MCGIFGEYSFGGQLLAEKEFRELNKLSRLRGPDMDRILRYKNEIQFGFNRLAILDLSEAAMQPGSSPSGRYFFVLNGELYNYKELQKKYQITQERLRSRADTEIFAQLLDLLPIKDCIDELNGMFALAVYDSREKRLYLSRDFAGIKPLYYAKHSGGIVFASQFDQVFKHPACKEKNICHQSLSDYLQLGYIPAPNTLYKNISQVQPGETLVFGENENHVLLRKHFFSGERGNISETESPGVDALIATLEKVIGRQLRSDLKVGSFLSGGIDSPLITAITKKVQKNLETFSIGFRDKELDESAFIKNYAEALKVSNRIEFYDSSELLSNIDAHFSAYSEPFGDFSSLPTMHLAGMAKKHFTVILSGDGGDELFWGYPRFLHAVTHAGYFRYPHVLRKFFPGTARLFGKKLSYGIQEKNFTDWILEKHSHNKKKWIREILPDFENSDFVKSLYHYDKGSNKAQDILLWLRKNEFYGHLQRVLLKVDRASMYHSLEVRVPFLDQDILNFAEALIPSLQKHKRPKILLKNALQKVMGDHPNINQKKIGFSPPIGTWLRNTLAPDLMDLLVHQDPYPANTFNRPLLTSYIMDFMKGKHNNYWGVWIFYALQKWKEKHLSN
jgi:asparagine synthase (glutamine-hydrolysing)